MTFARTVILILVMRVLIAGSVFAQVQGGSAPGTANPGDKIATPAAPDAQSVQSRNTLDSLQLTQKAATSLGEILDGQPGVAKRSFGPGAARPVIRGFDGDRVVVLRDGLTTGTLGSQSGDHAEPVNVLGAERLDILTGPATLLYGTYAAGGVVNVISGHHQMKEETQPGFRGMITGLAGSESRQGGGAVGFEYRVKNWLGWANSSNQKTGDYKSARSTVENSGSRLTDGEMGVGWYGKQKYGAVSYEYADGVYGIPLGRSHSDELTGEASKPAPVRLDYFRRNVHVSGAARDFVPFFQDARVALNYTSWNHRELDFLSTAPNVATTVENKDYTFQAFLEQKKVGRLTGTVGVFGMRRKFFSGGEQPVAPAVKADVAAAFVLEEFDFSAFKLQLGARAEYTRYRPRQLPQETSETPEPPPPSESADEENPEPPEPVPPAPVPPVPQPQNRHFTSGAGSLGIEIPAWRNGALRASFTHWNRAPALEELYNNGRHAGNLTFEIGNDALKNETNDGVEVSVRHIAGRVRAHSSFFLYRLDNFIFLAPTGNQNGDLTEAAYQQEDSRYTGVESTVDYQLRPIFGRTIWVNGGVDYVRAEIVGSNTVLPRIPPLRGRLGFEGNYRGVIIRPEAIVVQAQDRVFGTETPTPGYTVFNLNASYMISRQHTSHQFGLSVLNIGDRFYMNHVSFIKEIAPEPGRGVKLTYTLRFF